LSHTASAVAQTKETFMDDVRITALHIASDEPELVISPHATYVSVSGTGAPATSVWHRKKRLVTDIARQLATNGLAPEKAIEHVDYRYLDSMPATNIADFYSVNPLDELHYRALAQVNDGVTLDDIAAARRAAASDLDDDDELEIVIIPEQHVMQVMHHGFFAHELATLARLGAAAELLGLKRSGPHQEIYLDAFTPETPQDNLRTILRDPVA
jgi:hypothetical protein